MSLTEGTRLGRYRIRSQIGVGGMGEVYLAEDTVLRRSVAIKVLTADYTQSEERLHRFEREAFTASSLNHPNIVTIYEIGSEGGYHFIATEFVDGESLRQYLRVSQMDLREVLDVAIQVVSALTAAHEAGIVHRDIKPENIMRRRDGYLKVLDFGLAKLTDEAATTETDTEAPTQVMLKTEPGRVMGTINYMSPEQARGRDIDARTDIFSLGVVLYEMVAGRRPFGGDTKSDVMAAVLMVEPEPLAKKFPEVPAELNRIVIKSLRKDREERYQTAKELLVDLKNLRQDLEFEAKMGRPIMRVPGAAPATATSDGSAKRVSTVRQPDAPATISELFINEVKVHPRRATVTLSIIALVIAGAAIGLYRLVKLAQRPESFQGMKLTKVTSAGNVVEGESAISPDGKYVAYVAEEAGQQTLLVRQVATSSDVQIAPPATTEYSGLTFSPNGDYVYYAVVDNKRVSTLYRVAAFGGPSRKLIENADGPVSFSPDGSRVVFVRDKRLLMIANADGTSVQTLATAGDGKTWEHPAWSPDGQTIACGVFQTSDSKFHLAGIAVKDGAERPISSALWLFLGGMAWLPDGSGLLLAARDPESKLTQIWFLSYPEGKARRVTNDLSKYLGLTLTADGKTLLSVQSERVSNIWMVPGGDTSLARRLTTEAGKDEGLEGLSWTPDGRIVYSARPTGTWDLWIINQDGTNNRQLTFNARAYFPSVTPDGRYIVFASDRAGSQNIWRMDLDGGNVKQLTNSAGIAGYPNCSPDGQWVVYHIYDKKMTIWKVPIDGGTPIQLTHEYSERPSFSPDGKSVLCRYGDPSPKMALIPSDGGPPARLIDLPEVAQSNFFQWALDGRGVVYVISRDRVYNLWSQSLDGGPPKQLTSFSSDRIFKFAWSRDGKLLALARGHEGSDVVLISTFR
jgi:serine/threonine protein kinase/Tol biopolymer transport system component